MKTENEDIETLKAKARKYDALHSLLSHHVENPDDLGEVDERLVMAGSDELLDEVMDELGVDTWEAMKAKLDIQAELVGAVFCAVNRPDHCVDVEGICKAVRHAQHRLIDEVLPEGTEIRP